jgi:hypothetical protein
MRLLRILALVALVLAFMPAPAVAVTGFDSAYSGESAFVTIRQGESASFQVFFMNTGTVAWTKGSDTQVDLAACLSDKVTCNAQDPADSPWNNGWMSTTRYTTHTQAVVSTGSLATFAYNIKAPSNATGTHRFNGDLVVAKTGDRIHPEGYFQDATIDATGSVAVPTPSPTPGSTPFPSPPPPTGTAVPTPTPTATPTATPTPTPTPAPELGTLTVNGSLAATGCPDPAFTLTFAGTGLTAATTYHMTFTRTTPPPVTETPGFDFTTDAGGNFSETIGTVGAPAPSTFTMVVTDDGSPVTNVVGVTFACP